MVDFTTYFKVVLIKTYASIVSILPKSIPDKTAGEKSDSLSPKSFFWTSKQPFAIHFFLASCNVCHMAIPEISAQTQGSNYWQLIHSDHFYTN